MHHVTTVLIYILLSLFNMGEIWVEKVTLHSLETSYSLELIVIICGESRIACFQVCQKVNTTIDPDSKDSLPATDLLPIFPLFHASTEHYIVDAMLTKQSCISFAMPAAMLLISLNKMPIFESICNNTFLDISRQSSNGPVKYIVLFP